MSEIEAVIRGTASIMLVIDIVFTGITAGRACLTD